LSQILDVTRIDDELLRLNKECFNLSEVVLDAIEDLKTEIEKNNGKMKLLYEFKKEQTEKVPRGPDSSMEDTFIYADKNRINQVISNLVTNAIKFTKEGTVSILVTKKEGSIDEVIFTVKDTGTGIYPEILPRLFSIFFFRYPIRHRHWLGTIHFKKYCRGSWWKDMGRE
jgi:signal transduction histidine kinase